MSCSVPSWLKPWFNQHFKPECDWHDHHYVERDLPKFIADLGVAWRIGIKYWWSFPLGLGAAVVLALHPQAYSKWFKDESKVWRW